MRIHYRAPDGLVHLSSLREKHQSPAYQETVCEEVQDIVRWSGTQLKPTNEDPTCVVCIGGERRAMG